MIDETFDACAVLRRPHGAIRAAAALFSMLLLMAPALWNGFPLLQYDTGGYLARWYEGTLVVSRGVAYGLLLTASAPLDFWPAVIVQSALTVWVIGLMLRALGLRRAWMLSACIAALSLLTTLPWLTAILLTDIFCGLSVLALYLVVLRGDALKSWESAALIVLIGYAMATHSATSAVLMALLAAAALARLRWRTLPPLAGLARGLTALALGVAMVFAANFTVAHRLAWTPGGFALSFGRMLQDGIVARYLDEHCPDPRLRLCAYRNQLPRDADEFFWGSELFDKLGRFAGLGEEMRTIALESVIDYPWMQIKTASVAAAKQLVSVRTGEGVLNSIWHTYAIIKRYAPQAAPAMLSARQQKGGIDFSVLNLIDVPVALGSLLLLLAVLWLGCARPAFAEFTPFAATVLLAILANAAICGIFSNPHDRYGARVIWLAPLVVATTVLRGLERSQRSTLAPQE